MEILFLIKKGVSFFIQPLGFLLLTSLIVFISIKTKHLFTKFVSLVLFAGLFGLSYAPVANFLSSHLEEKYSPYVQQKAAYIAVLGNGHNEAKNLPISSILGSASTKRVLEAISIYQQLKPKPKVIFTGYAGLGNNIPTAKMGAKFAQKFGVNEADLIILGTEKDTQEEAISIKNIVKNQAVILITSAMHLPRAVVLFKQQDINFIGVPADFKTNNTGFLSLPKISYLQQSNQAIHEYLGMGWIQLKQTLKEVFQ